MAAVYLFILNSVSRKNECSQGHCEGSSSRLSLGNKEGAKHPVCF